MIQEYLFTDSEKIKDQNDLCINEVVPEIEKTENSECIIVKYVLTTNNDKSAKKLSAINDEIIAKYNPTVLTNESSAYFNKTLYPLFNEFERKLRKLLYLKSALSPQVQGVENIKDLEKKDFGTIFTMLFTDSEFVNGVRKSVNEKTWQFSKKDIIKKIQEMSEHTLWEELIGKDLVPSLCSNFINVKDHRNDVMHAHNINAKSFNSAKSLIKKINKQLDTEIGLIISKKEIMAYQDIDNSFNGSLSDAIKSANVAAQTVAKALANVIMTYDGMYDGVINAIQEVSRHITPYPTLGELMYIKDYAINNVKETEKDNNEQNEI